MKEFNLTKREITLMQIIEKPRYLAIAKEIMTLTVNLRILHDKETVSKHVYLSALHARHSNTCYTSILEVLRSMRDHI